MFRSVLRPDRIRALTQFRRTSTRSKTPKFFSTSPRVMEAPKNMSHWKIAVEASKSSDFRRVLWTGKHSQVVIMNVPVGGEIGEEIHTVDQHLSFMSGVGKAIVNGKEEQVTEGSLVVVPTGAKHNFINTGNTPLLLYTVYAPAEHKDGAVHKTKEEGDRLEDEGDDEPPEFK